VQRLATTDAIPDIELKLHVIAKPNAGHFAFDELICQYYGLVCPHSRRQRLRVLPRRPRSQWVYWREAASLLPTGSATGTTSQVSSSITPALSPTCGAALGSPCQSWSSTMTTTGSRDASTTQLQSYLYCHRQRRSGISISSRCTVITVIVQFDVAHISLAPAFSRLSQLYPRARPCIR